MSATTETQLSIRVARVDALFGETPFMPALPDLDPGPALDHLVRRLGDGKFAHRSLRVSLVSESVTDRNRCCSCSRARSKNATTVLPARPQFVEAEFSCSSHEPRKILAITLLQLR